MTTLCRAFADEKQAQAAVERLLASGLPGADVRVLMGAPLRDARTQATGEFAGEADPGDPVGSFAGAAAGAGAGMGGYAGDADRMRAGGFGDADRETVATYPGGVERVRVAGHRALERMLREAGLDAATARADVEALHAGRVLVLVATGAAPDAVAAALDGRRGA